MELILLLAIIGGGWYWYQKSPYSQNKGKANAIEMYMKQANEAYAFLTTHHEKMIKEDIPKWVKEAKDNVKSWKKTMPNEPVPNSITWQPEQQEARIKETESEVKELQRVRDKFMRIMLRNEHNTDVSLRFETVYDWNQWVVGKANLNGWNGWEGMIYKDEAEKTAWKIKYEEIEKRFDDRLK